MTQFTQAKLFRQSCLAAAVSMFAAPSVYALQDLSDEALSATTGEGVALTLENFKMVFQGPNDRSTASSYASGMVDPGKNDTGFIRIIPTGENYEQLGQRYNETQINALRTKADVFIYGLALSNSKDKNGKSSLATRYTDQGFNWGTAENPWLFHAGNQDVEQFSANNKGNVGYLAIEAPLKKIAADDASNNIKLGLWMDVFSRSLNSSNVVDPITGAPTSGLDKDYRLRTQIVANGLSLNGSQVRIFQTLKSTNANYNQTLGLASLIRINTNDRAESLSINDSDLDARGIRISTAARSELDDGTAATPAMDRSVAPIFHETEGLYLYSPNINLVLGNMYQPFIVGSEGRNIILEVTRIPNVPSIYSKIYTYYTDIAGNTTGTSGLTAADFKGSTCNVYSCGTELKANSSDATALYQGRNATHSSIAIGTVERLPGNLLNAKSTDTATGVVFKGVNGQSTNLGSVAIDGVLIQHLKIRTTGL